MQVDSKGLTFFPKISTDKALGFLRILGFLLWSTYNTMVLNLVHVFMCFSELPTIFDKICWYTSPHPPFQWCIAQCD